MSADRERDLPYSKQERRNRMVLVSLFRKNSLPYTLLLLSILFEFAYVVTLLDNMAVGPLMGATVLADIVILFLLFVCAVKVNAYSLPWTYAAFALCAFFALRASFIVPLVLRPFSRQTEILLFGGAAAALQFLAGMLSLSVISRRRRHIRSHPGGAEVNEQ